MVFTTFGGRKSFLRKLFPSCYLDFNISYQEKGTILFIIKKGTSLLGTIHTKSDMILEKQEPPETVKH